MRVIYAPDVPHSNVTSDLVADIPEYQWIDLTRFDVLENQVRIQNFSVLNKIPSSSQHSSLHSNFGAEKSCCCTKLCSYRVSEIFKNPQISLRYCNYSKSVRGL